MIRVLFICTAKQIDTVPGPLLDRMELLQLAGYTEAEKLVIARRYLIPRQIVGNGLAPSADQRPTTNDESIASPGEQVEIGDLRPPPFVLRPCLS